MRGTSLLSPLLLLAEKKESQKRTQRIPVIPPQPCDHIWEVSFGGDRSDPANNLSPGFRASGFNQAGAGAFSRSAARERRVVRYPIAGGPKRQWRGKGVTTADQEYAESETGSVHRQTQNQKGVARP